MCFFYIYLKFNLFVLSYFPDGPCMDVHRESCVPAYLNGVAEFLKAAEKNVVDTEDPWVLCPCYDYKNIMSFNSTTQIQTHLIQRGFMDGYECWSQHEEAEHRTDEEGHSYEE